MEIVNGKKDVRVKLGSWIVDSNVRGRFRFGDGIKINSENYSKFVDDILFE